MVVYYTVSLILINITITHRAQADHREKEVLYLQSRVLQDRLFTLKDKEASLRILRHDLRHHLNTLHELLQSGELGRALDYISQLDRNLVQIRQGFYCANAVINAVVSCYAAKAQSAEIRFSASVQITDYLPVEDLDIGAVLSNALENAQNACQAQPADTDRFIDLKFVSYQRQYVLDVTNSFDGAAVFDGDGRPVSQNRGHGIGSQSILAFAKEYSATVDYCAVGGVFNIRILFSGP